MAAGSASRLLLEGTSISSGYSLHFDGVSVTTSAAPVPEPSSALLAIGSGALLLMRRRRALV